MSFVLGAFLVTLGVVLRLVPHPPNAVPLGALCLFAAARLPGRWAWVIPLVTMGVADLILDAQAPQFAVDWPTRATIYGTYLVITLLGGLVGRDAGPWTRDGMAVIAATLFYLTTNFAVWAAQAEEFYPHTAAGLVACYVAALPFYLNSLIAELIGTRLLFEFEPGVSRALSRWLGIVRRPKSESPQTLGA